MRILFATVLLLAGTAWADHHIPDHINPPEPGVVTEENPGWSTRHKGPLPLGRLDWLKPCKLFEETYARYRHYYGLRQSCRNQFPKDYAAWRDICDPRFKRQLNTYKAESDAHARQCMWEAKFPKECLDLVAPPAPDWSDPLEEIP